MWYKIFEVSLFAIPALLALFFYLQSSSRKTRIQALEKELGKKSASSKAEAEEYFEPLRFIRNFWRPAEGGSGAQHKNSIYFEFYRPRPDSDERDLYDMNDKIRLRIPPKGHGEPMLLPQD